MITRLSFQNYRSYGDTSFSLQPINLLIGSVAAGKSNIFKGLLLLKNSIRRSLQELFPQGSEGFSSVKSWWASVDAPIRFEVDLDQLDDFPGQGATYCLAIANSADGPYIEQESLRRREPGQASSLIFRRSASQDQVEGDFEGFDRNGHTLLQQITLAEMFEGERTESFQFAASVARSLGQFGYYHLSAPRLKASGTGRPSLGISYDGSGLPDLMAWLKLESGQGSVYRNILRAIQELLPDLVEINIVQTNLDRQNITMSFEGHRDPIGVTNLSDGTMLTLALLCLIHNPDRPNLLCIEEPEAGLNPRRLRWLFEQFVALAYPTDGTKATQVIFSTHSPGLVDLFGADLQDSVLLVEHDKGRSRVKPLVEIQRERLHQEPDPSDPIGHLWATGVYEGL